MQLDVALVQMLAVLAFAGQLFNSSVFFRLSLLAEVQPVWLLLRRSCLNPSIWPTDIVNMCQKAPCLFFGLPVVLIGNASVSYPQSTCLLLIQMYVWVSINETHACMYFAYVWIGMLLLHFVCINIYVSCMGRCISRWTCIFQWSKVEIIHGPAYLSMKTPSIRLVGEQGHHLLVSPVPTLLSALCHHAQALHPPLVPDLPVCTAHLPAGCWSWWWMNLQVGAEKALTESKTET